MPRADRWAIAVLVVLPVLVFAVPAFAGHSVLPGDDFTQNYPLRAFVGSQIRHGHLPLMDPYIWSGAPLLAGWNAGAAYPLTLLFVIFPATAAWALNLLATWWVAGLGSFAFLRASHLSSLPSFLGAFSFCFAGAMTAQVVHFGLVAGVSWTPVALLAVLRISELSYRRPPDRPRRRLRASRIRWLVVLAVAVAMTILAGEPRAITTAWIIVGVYTLWRALRVPRAAARCLGMCACGLSLGLAIGAVQWIAGNDAVNSSQRALSSAYLFTSGSLPLKWLLLLVVPDLLGGSGSFGQPSFLASYNLTEVTGYVGLMPLVAAFALLGQLRRKRPLPEWIVWEVVALVGILLALGNSTPLWHVLIHIPFFGGQRLQSRNLLIADMGFAFLLAYWSHSWLAGRAERRTTSRRRAQVFTGALPALAAVTTVVVGLCWGAGMLHWLGTTLRAGTHDGALRPWFLPFGVLAMMSLVLLVLGPRWSPALRSRALVALVVLDLIVFISTSVVAVDTGLGHPAATPSVTSATTTNPSAASPGSSLASPPTDLPAGAFTDGGRFAIYDPDLIDTGGLDALGAPDLNVVDAVPSVQGYSSIVDGTYANATGTHQATGLGQDILSPSALSNGTFDQLDMRVLFSPREYFLVTSQDEIAATPSAGDRRLGARGRASWYLGENLLVKQITFPDTTAARDLDDGLRFSLVELGGKSVATPRPTLVGPHMLEVVLEHPVAAVEIVAYGDLVATDLGAPSLISADGTSYSLDGQLQGVVVPPRWVPRAIDGAFAVFEDVMARPILTLHPLPRHPGSTAGASVRAITGSSTSPSAARVSSPDGVEVVRAVAAIPGWYATWHPDRGLPISLPVQRYGIVQEVAVPAGTGTLEWKYDPPGWTEGWVLSAAGLLLLCAALGWALFEASRQDSFTADNPAC